MTTQAEKTTTDKIDELTPNPNVEFDQFSLIDCSSDYEYVCGVVFPESEHTGIGVWDSSILNVIVESDRTLFTFNNYRLKDYGKYEIGDQ